MEASTQTRQTCYRHPEPGDRRLLLQLRPADLPGVHDLDPGGDGVAVLIVSEDLGEILEVCDRVAVMAGGRLSPVREVRETHAAEIGAWMAGGFLR